jgi:DNA polymerase-3 subunit alpha
MGTVQAIVSRAAEVGMPGVALTDHGTMAGSIALYKACQKAGIAPFPGMEAYLVRDADDPQHRDTRYHLGLIALDHKGYQTLVRLTSKSFEEGRFHRKPLIDFADLSALADEGLTDHIACTTGCHFGLVGQAIAGGRDPKHFIRLLRQWFPDTLYVELQDHNVVHDDGKSDSEVLDLLYEAAQSLGLPVVLGQDSHYLNESEQPVHDLMKDICYFGDGEDFHFPGGPYHLASAKELVDLVPAKVWMAVEEGHCDLLDRHALTMPALDKYKFHVPKTVSDPDDVLKRKAQSRLVGIKNRLKIKQWPQYDAQLARELDVIAKMGMADYFLIVQDIIDEVRRCGGLINVRGSANGSLVLYCQGVTKVDPILWGTSFDRFLSLDRMKPPDVDLDMDRKGLERALEYTRSRFPSMVRIGTYSKIGITQQTDEDTGLGDDKGSVFVQYMAAMRRKVPDFDGKVKREHRATLNALSDTAVRKSLGAHASGYVLPVDDHPIDLYLPKARIISSGTWVTQMEQDDVEAAGYMKIDFLGLRSLTTLNQALVNIGKKPDEWDWIPWNDRKACGVLRSGAAVGVFQYEGGSQGRWGKDMGVKNTLEAIVCLTLARPAVEQQAQVYLYNRSKARADQLRLHPMFDSILDVTHGVCIFQEQVMEMCRAIGMSYADYNELMTAVKASNGNIANAIGTFNKIGPIFMDLCVKQGLTQDEAGEAWEAVSGFTDYAFNRAHATSYGIMAYRGAYLKAHYPLEFMHACLHTWAGDKKERIYIHEARRMGITIVRPDVNHSDVSWAIDHSRKTPTLRKGLLSIAGIGATVAEHIVEHRPQAGWSDLTDFCKQLPARPISGVGSAPKGKWIGVCKTLKEAGAMRSLGVEADA